MRKFSIIVPVYNTPEKMLRDCLESVLKQVYENFEVIVIDDGSEGTTASIIDEIAEGDSRVRVYHEENAGAGESRNKGIELAAGEYIWFVDSDDFVITDRVLEEIAEVLEESKAEVLSLDYTEFFSEDSKPTEAVYGKLERDKINGKNREEALKTLLSSVRRTFSSSPYNKILKRDFIVRNEIKFAEGVVCEDVYFTAQVVKYAQTFDRYNKAVYAVRRANIGSVTQGGVSRVVTDMVKVFDNLMSREEIRQDKYVMNFLSSPYAYWVGKLAVEEKRREEKRREEKRREEKRRMLGYRYVLGQGSRKDVLLVRYSMKVIGLAGTVFLLRIFFALNPKHFMSPAR